jgi:hypothetical protein
MARRTTIGINPLDAVTPAPGIARARPPSEEMPAATGTGLTSQEPAAGAGAGYTVFDLWVDGIEATMRATLSAQSGVLAAGLSLVDATANGGCATLHQWAEATRQAQEAALEGFQANVRAASQLVWLGGPVFTAWRGR